MELFENRLYRWCVRAEPKIQVQAMRAGIHTARSPQDAREEHPWRRRGPVCVQNVRAVLQERRKSAQARRQVSSAPPGEQDCSPRPASLTATSAI